MRNKRIFGAAIVLAILIGSVLAFAGCSPEEPMTYLYADGDVFIPNTGYAVFFGDERGVLSIDQDKVRYWLDEDNTADAELNGNMIYAKKPGRATVWGSYTLGGKTYEEYLYFHFEGLQLEMSLDGEIRVGERIPLRWAASCGGNSVYEGDVLFREATVIAGDAQLEGSDGNYTLLFNSMGEVTVRMVCEYSLTTYTFEQTFTSEPVDLKMLEILPDTAEFVVGAEIHLSAALDVPDFDASRVVYTVKSGDASMEGSVLKAYTPGDVVISATYEQNGETYSSRDLTMTFVYGGNTISNAEGLMALANNSGEYFLIQDIDLSAYDSWTPIENFTGKLNGGGYTIRGLSVSAKSMEENKGLFAVLGGTVEDLKIEGSVKSNGEAKYLGMLCGTNNGTIKNVTVSGTVDAPYSDYVGGIVGTSSNSNVTKCTSNATVTARNYVGGQIGSITVIRSDETVLTGNHNTGNVSGASYVGGVYGCLGTPGGNSNVTIMVVDNTNSGTITGSEQYAGGIGGYMAGEYHYSWGDYTANIRITECENTGNVTGADYVGGIVGNAETCVSEIAFSRSTGDIKGSSYVGGYAGRAVGTVLEGLINDKTITGKSYVGGIAGYAGKLESCTNNGTLVLKGFTVTESNQNVSYAGGIAGYATGAEKCVNNADIDAISAGDYVGGIAGYVWSPRSAENVVLDNKNHGSIMGTGYLGGVFGYFGVAGGDSTLTITLSANTNDGEIVGSKDYVGGIVGYITGEYHYHWADYTASVRITESENDGNITGANYVGGIVGNANNYVSEISLGSNTGNIAGANYVGGYAGRANGTHMKSLINSKTVTGKSYVGGIAGYAGKLESCTNSGTLDLAGFVITDDNRTVSYAGGVAGYATGAVDCVNNSNIDASGAGDYVGGIAGYIMSPRNAENVVKGNKNHGAITGTGYLGGVFGYFGVGGGDSTLTITVSENINDGEIVGSKDYVGGIVGYITGEYHYNWGGYTASIRITDSENEANITGANYVGGIVGNANNYVTDISFGSSMGDVAGASYVGGYVGRANGTTLQSLINNSNITGKFYVGGVAGYAGKLEKCTNNGVLFLAGFELTSDNRTVSYAGGVAGYATGAVDCVNNSNIDASGAGDYVGGIAGYLQSPRNTENVVQGNKNHGAITGTGYLGGVFGYFSVDGGDSTLTISVTANTNDGEIIGTKDYVGGIIGYMIGEYHYNWGGYTAYISITACENEANITGANYVGGILGNGENYVTELAFSKNEGDVTGSQFVGGYAGRAYTTTMRQLTNNSTISGTFYVGGIAGSAGQCIECKNYGNVFNQGYGLTDDNKAVSYLGGIAGYATGADGCVNEANIDARTGGDYVGGIVGYMEAERSDTIHVKNNKNHGTIQGTAYVGGLAGKFSVKGGIDSNVTILVTSNTNDGDISGTKDCVGGIVGYMTGAYHYNWGGYTASVKVTTCRNEANVAGADYVGGLVGQCTTYVLSDEVIWNTNAFTGQLTASGENQGNFYGFLG